MNLSPSELRTRILADHVVLRAQLGELEKLAARARTGDARAQAELRPASLSLVSAITRHILLENNELVPLVRELDFAWGELRAQAILREHEHHLAALRWIVDATEQETVADLAEAITPLNRSLRQDMAEEEETLLRPDFLKDDTISVSEDG
jgi:hypothetical protein